MFPFKTMLFVSITLWAVFPPGTVLLADTIFGKTDRFS
jgi:hypothetical protein